MSNKRIDALAEEFQDRGEFIHAIVSPPLTYVGIQLGDFVGVGYMRCGPDDVFDSYFGVEGAIRKALKHIAAQQDELRTRDILNGNDPVTLSFTLDPLTGERA